MKIGNVEIKNKTVLAPMAGVADRAFRELCFSFGASYCVGEMASAKGISMSDKKSKQLLFLSDKERPAAVQIFGDDPDTVALAAISALAYSPEIIDINMGCPAPKISGNGGGAALMKNPELAQRIVEKCVKAVSIPVTVKIRTGWDSDSIIAPSLAKSFENAGAAAITIHGRTKMQMYAPPVNYDIIKETKAAVKIPVIGNGDVTDGISAVKMLETGCDLIMIGRGALGSPWVFRQINTYLETGEIISAPSLYERMEIMIEHINNICDYKGTYIGIREARKHAAWYIKGIKNAAIYRNEIGALQSIDELKTLAERIVRENESA